MPAVPLQQFRIFHNGEQPLGMVLWAQADEIAAMRIDAGDKRLPRRSGRAGHRAGLWMWLRRLGAKPR